MFTQRAALLGFVAFCFYLIGVVNSLPSFYYVLTWLVIGVLGASLGITLLSLIGLKCDLKIARARASASLGVHDGAAPSLAAALSNSGTLNKTSVVLEIALRDAQNRLWLERFLLAAIPSGAAIEANLPLAQLKRGHYRLQDARLRGSDVLGLFRTQKSLALGETALQEIFVGPPIVRVENRHHGAGGLQSGSQRAIQSGRSDELRGTRPYAPGDDLRHVHWKSSARAGDLVVKEFEQAGRDTPLVLWDAAAATTWGAREWDSTEWCLIGCASLCQSLLARGVPCDFARLDAAPLLVEARALVGGELPSPLTDALARARAERTVSLDEMLQQLPALSTRFYSTVFLVSASLSPDVGRNAQFWRHRGTRARVLLVDGASLGARSGERQFRKNNGRFPTQTEGAASIAVTSDNYDEQAAQLRRHDAAVVLVRAMHTDQSPQTVLHAALQELF